MTEVEWMACTDPQTMLDLLRGNASDRKLRLFAVACCRRVWHLLVDERSRKAGEVAERLADGAASEQDLETARGHAWEFANHVVHDDDAFFHLDDFVLNAADVPAWTAEMVIEPLRVVIAAQRSLGIAEGIAQADILRCIFGNPFRPASLDAVFLTPTIKSVAQSIYDDRNFNEMPILGNDLELAGCTNTDILNHCRKRGEHVRSCWVVDLILGKS